MLHMFNNYKYNLLENVTMSKEHQKKVNPPRLSKLLHHCSCLSNQLRQGNKLLQSWKRVLKILNFHPSTIIHLYPTIINNREFPMMRKLYFTEVHVMIRYLIEPDRVADTAVLASGSSVLKHENQVPCH